MCNTVLVLNFNSCLFLVHKFLFLCFSPQGILSVRHMKPRRCKSLEEINFLRSQVGALRVKVLRVHPTVRLYDWSAHSVPDRLPSTSYVRQGEICVDMNVDLKMKDLDLGATPANRDSSDVSVCNNTTSHISSSLPRIILIGDIHGCFAELESLLQRTGYDPSRDLLVHVGDLVVKGPESEKVVKFMKDHSAYGVVGNHDWQVLRWASRARPFIEASEHPSRPAHQTLARILPPDLLVYLQNLPHVLYLPEYDVVVTHAALDSPMEHTNAYDAMHARSVVLSSTAELNTGNHAGNNTDALGMNYSLQQEDSKVLQEIKPPGEQLVKKIDRNSSDMKCQNENSTELIKDSGSVNTKRDITNALSEKAGIHSWASGYQSTSLVVFGHDAARKLQKHCSALGLDTGCVYGGRLSALLLPDREVVSVRSAQVYVVPGE